MLVESESSNFLQNTFSPIGSRTTHRPIIDEYPAPDRTTFSGKTLFHTIPWHITMKAICKNRSTQKVGIKT